MSLGEPTEYMDRQDADDRRFLSIVSNVIGAAEEGVRELAIIRVDNWFGHRWLRFSGVGRIPYGYHGQPSHPGVALDDFFQDKLTFPPFNPRRILRQQLWTLDTDRPKTRLVHPRVLRQSADNLHRRVADFSDSMIAIWFSSRTEDNQRGSVMQYSSMDGRLDAWYASFFVQQGVWQVQSAKGTDRRQVQAFLDDKGPPSG